jgi:hypothetical protein
MTKPPPKSFVQPGGLNTSRRGTPIEGWSGLISHPIAIVVFSLITFALTFTVLLWRDGYFSTWFVAKGAVVAKGSRAWMLGNKHRYHESPAQNHVEIAPKKASIPEEPTTDQPGDVVLDHAL